METTKKHRKVLRSTFTKKVNELSTLMDASKKDITAIKVCWDIVQEKFEAIKLSDSEIYNHLLEQDASEEDLLAEMEAAEAYKKKFLEVYHRYEALVHSEGQDAASQGNTVANGATGKRKFKLPTIQFKMFDGNIKEWLPFWSQFRKVHEDPDVDLEDKIEYLVQATVPGSRARQLVDSFPIVGENYQKIIDSLTSRFGREDLQVEVYIRELLKLILNNAMADQKLDLLTLYDKLETQLRALETLGITTDKCAAMLFPLVESCLPEDLLRIWQRSHSSQSLPSIPTSESSLSNTEQNTELTVETRLKNLMHFLQKEVENEQRITLASEGFGLKSTNRAKESMRSTGSYKQKMEHFDRGIATAAGLVNCDPAVVKCIFCDNTHESASCFKAQKFSLHKKRSILSAKKACFSCLKVGHQVRKCQVHLKCVICGKSHVSLMCPDLPSNKQENVQQKSTKAETSQVPSEAVSCMNNVTAHVFMQTMKLRLDGDTRSQMARALIDTGSQRSYILESTACQLGLKSKRQDRIIHCLFGGVMSERSHECYDLRISHGRFSFVMEALAQPVICNKIPPVFYGPWSNEIENLGIDLSDKCDGSTNSREIEILIGADVAGKLYTGRRYVLSCGLVVVETFLGWVLMGKIPLERPFSTTMTDIVLLVKDANIPQLWELDVLGIKDPVEKKSQDELAIAAKELFLQTVRVDGEGRYEVRLPWLEGHPPLMSAYHLAKNRLRNTVSKLERDNLLQEYDQVFKEWLEEGIVEEVREEEHATTEVHYLPHRPVVKEGSTTKIRPVFDASAREKEKPSLNQCLEKGPNLIELIPTILLRFRLDKIGVIADIKKAFLQISIHQADRDFLRFLWMGVDGKEKIFRHKRVVFGVSSSPFLLGATIEHHLSETLKESDGGKAPYSKETILRLSKAFYVDNCVASVPNEVDLRRFIEEASVVMRDAKFDLRGWEFSKQIRDDPTAPSQTAVLGLSWDTQEDTLSINKLCSEVDEELFKKPITKRIILSFAQRIFDPIGFTSPVTLLPKLLLQKTWEKKLSWDAAVDAEVERDFRRWVGELRFLLNIKIPRWIHRSGCNIREGSLHIFCDASKDSYAAVIFFRAVCEEQVFVYLLAAKSRVAPLRLASIPRLELLAALIGTRLYASVKEELNPDSTLPSYFWSDSSTVISWIRRNEDWGTFVGNRVSEIRKQTSKESWHFVPGVLNPADLPSRGCSPKQLQDSRWWEGPDWLYDEPPMWPQEDIICNEDDINKEKKKKVVTTLLVSDMDMSLDDWHMPYFSKISKVIRMISWISRFLHNASNPLAKQEGELTVEEIDSAEIRLFKLLQRECFAGVSDPKLSSLNPFIDATGLIRLKSRICAREDAELFRYPLVLPAKHYLVNRLIFDQHVKSNHVGAHTLMGMLREKYWILGGRRSIKSAISRCVICKKHNSKPFVTTLPPLPLDRVRDAAAFEVTGIDFAGPLFLKTGEKAWVCLFTCAVFRAVHLELCSSLSVSNFMLALRRFVARRGRPHTIYSDNGTNFVGTENAFNKLDWRKIQTNCSVEKIVWRFNPPTAAWWGGFWERLVGVLKQMLRKVLGHTSIGYEDMVTLLCDCESIINARPLTYVSGDPTELTTLTPMMFLREQTEAGIPDCDAVDRHTLCRKNQYLQKLRDDFRQRFRIEYLGQLKSWRTKKPNRKIVLGEVVLIGNDNDKRLHWPLGRVVQLIPGKDGSVRLARVRTSRGTLLRPVQRLYPLECDDDPSSRIPARNVVTRPTSLMEENLSDPESTNEVRESAEVLSRVSVSPEPTSEVRESAGVLSRAPVSLPKVSRSGRQIKVPNKYL